MILRGDRGALLSEAHSPVATTNVRYAWTQFSSLVCTRSNIHRFLLVGAQLYVGYPLGQLIRLPYAVQVMSDIKILEAFGKTATGCGPPLWPPLGPQHPEPVPGHYGINYKSTGSSGA